MRGRRVKGGRVESNTEKRSGGRRERQKEASYSGERRKSWRERPRMKKDLLS